MIVIETWFVCSWRYAAPILHAVCLSYWFLKNISQLALTLSENLTFGWQISTKLAWYLVIFGSCWFQNHHPQFWTLRWPDSSTCFFFFFWGTWGLASMWPLKVASPPPRSRCRVWFNHIDWGKPFNKPFHHRYLETFGKGSPDVKVWKCMVESLPRFGEDDDTGSSAFKVSCYLYFWNSHNVPLMMPRDVKYCRTMPLWATTATVATQPKSKVLAKNGFTWQKHQFFWLGFASVVSTFLKNTWANRIQLQSSWPNMAVIHILDSACTLVVIKNVSDSDPIFQRLWSYESAALTCLNMLASVATVLSKACLSNLV